MNYETAVFDMDGTVLNTLGDLRDAVNYSFEKTGHRHDFTEEETKDFFGSGVVVAVERALILEKGYGADVLESVGQTKGPEDFGLDREEISRIVDIYKPYYASHCAIKTGPYPGIREALEKLRASGVKTAVVSNKPDDAVQTLVKDHFSGLFDFSLGEMPSVRRKPAPDMTDRCLSVLQTERKDAVYIGDSEIDMLTAKNSGLDCISVSWGFRGRRFLKEHGAAKIADTADDVVRLILD